MTTRAGLVGLGAGLLLSLALFYPLYVVLPTLCVDAASQQAGLWVAAGVPAAMLLVLSGGLAAAWSGTANPRLRVWLGALAGWLAAVTLFCSLGAAAGSAPGLGYAFRALGEGMASAQVAGAIVQVTSRTQWAFWSLMLAGIALGALGGWRFAPASVARRAPPAGKDDPMMAFNASITALPAAALAVVLAEILSSRLLELLQQTSMGAVAAPAQPLRAALGRPPATALLLYLAAQLALLLTTGYETNQVEHRCGLDEVKVAAYVGISTPVAFIVALGLLDPPRLFEPFTSSCLLVSLGMVARQARVLYASILPRRAGMPAPSDPLEAAFFGTIAASRWQPLALLCLGCSVLIVLPIYVALAPAISAAFVPVSLEPAITGVIGLTASTPVALLQRLYRVHAVAGLGAILVLTLVLTAMYLFYNHLGCWFRGMRKKSGGAGSHPR